jgi:sugar lactone lactonase YvrE
MANDGWLHLDTANQSGTGSTNVIFSYDANPDVTRTGTLTIGGQTLTVNQAGSSYVAAPSVATTLASSGLGSPWYVDVDGAGSVYIADGANHAIKSWAPMNNTVSTVVTLATNSVAVGVAVDGAGNVYMSDQGDNTLKVWSAANHAWSTLVSSGLNTPYAIAVDWVGNVYIADTGNNAIKAWTVANNAVTTLAGTASMPYGVGVDRAGNVYFPDGNSIKKWTAANNSVTRSGYYFYGVAVDGAGNVHYSATAAPVFRVIGKWKAASNTFTTLVSSGLSIPRGVAVDRAGNVYFTDLGYQTVRELPHAFVDPTAKTEGPAAGSHVLPGVLPATANLLAPFAPTSDQPWLTVTGITNGVVSFAFEANTGSSNRTAHITLLGQPISITQTAPVTPPTLIGPTVLSNGTIQFAFSNSDLGVSFTVLTATNLSLPLTDWTVAGPATNTAPGLFQFSTGTTNNPQGFYRVRSP